MSSDMFTQGKYGAAKGIIGNAIDNGAAEDESSGRTLSAISQGTIVITDEMAQLEKTGKTTEETLANLNRDTENAHVAAQRLDVMDLQRQAEAEQIIKKAVFAEAIKFSDEAYRTMFLKERAIYEVIRGEDGKIVFDENGVPQTRKLTQSEKENLKPGSGGRVKVFTNGIFGDEETALGYTAQNIHGGKEAIYLVTFPQADSFIAEFMVVGCQKFLENDFWGLANATAEIRDLMESYGNSGLDLSGNNHGSMTIGNAMESLLRARNSQESLGDTLIRFFGPAYSAERAAGMLYELSGGRQNAVCLQSHKGDIVGVLGGNRVTYSAVPDNSYKVKEWINVFKDSPSVRSCYGNALQECVDTYGKAKIMEIKW